jgi:hypothetical protein
MSQEMLKFPVLSPTPNVKQASINLLKNKELKMMSLHLHINN